MLGYYNYTVILTYIGMLCAFTGITFSFRGNLGMALLCLMLSGLCDMFDGKIASTLKTRTSQEKHFGIEIDSLSDLICFGLLPAVILFTQKPDSLLITVISGLYALAALVRLAYFNVDEVQRQHETSERRKEYRGLPVTSSALLIPLAHALDQLLGKTLIAPVLMVVMGTLFLSPIKLKKPDMPGLIAMVAIGIIELVLLIRGVF